MGYVITYLQHKKKTQQNPSNKNSRIQKKNTNIKNKSVRLCACIRTENQQKSPLLYFVFP